MRAALLLSFALLAACGGAAPEPETAPAPPRIVRSADGAEIDMEALVEALAGARVVLLGERHDQAGDHEMQRAVTLSLLERDPSVALGFEMFQRPYQGPLDEYAAGTIDEVAMLEATEWEDRWGYDFGMYRPLVSLGPERRARLLALNAPREITRAVAREGLEALTEQQRAQLPELDLDDDAHRAVIEQAFAGHPGMSDAMIQRFYTAQVIWDETMASTVAEHLSTDEPAARVFVYAGVMHVMRPAIPARIRRRVDVTTASVMPCAPEDVDEARELADFLWVSAPME